MVVALFDMYDRVSHIRCMLGFIYLGVSLASYYFMNRYDMSFWDDDAMGMLRCMLVCVSIDTNIENVFNEVKT